MRIYDSQQHEMSKRTKTPEGYLMVADNRMARPGLLTYLAREIDYPGRRGDEFVTVYRPPALVFDQAVVGSFRSKPVTMGHPGEKVTAKNFRGTAAGFSKDDIRVEDNHLVGSLLITDAEVVDYVEKQGNIEISLGYDADIDYTPGSGPDGKYDATFTRMTGNHIALVPRGRNGRSCRISDADKEKEPTMAKVVLDGVTYELSDQGVELVQKLQAQAQAEQANTAKLVAEHAKAIADAEANAKAEAQKTIDKLQAQLDDAKSKIVTDEEIEKRVKARAELLNTVKTLIQDFDAAGKSDAAIRAEVVSQVCKIDVKDRSPEYIQARFDALTENVDPYKAAFGQLGKDIADSAAAGESKTYVPAWQEHRNKRIAENATAWQPEVAKKEGDK